MWRCSNQGCIDNTACVVIRHPIATDGELTKKKGKTGNGGGFKEEMVWCEVCEKLVMIEWAHEPVDGRGVCGESL